MAKKSILGLGLAGLASVLAFAVCVPVQATEGSTSATEATETTNINKNFEDDYFTGSSDESAFESTKDIRHNLFEAGNLVHSKDKVQGLFFVAGNSLDLESVTDYSFIAGNTVTVAGEVKNDVFAAGNVIKFNGKVGRDVYAAGNEIVFQKTIGGNVFVYGNKITFEDGAVISGNIDLAATEVSFGKNVTINGLLRYNDTATMTGLDGVKVGLAESYHVEESELDGDALLAALGMFVLICFGGMMLTSLIGFAVLPGFRKKLHVALDTEVFPAKYSLIALLATVLVPLTAILLLFTLIGIPLAILGSIMFIIALIFAYPIAGVYVGRLILHRGFKRESSVYTELILGYSIVSACMLIPFVGSLVSFMASYIGLGYIGYVLFDRKLNGDKD